MMKPLSLSFSLSSFSARSILLSFASRLRSTDRHESPAIGGSGSLAFRCLLRRTDRAGCDRAREHRASGTPISGSEELGEMPLLKIRWRDPNSMQLARSAKAHRAPRRIIMRDVDQVSQCHDIQLRDDPRCDAAINKFAINSRYHERGVFFFKHIPARGEEKLRESLRVSNRILGAVLSDITT